MPSNGMELVFGIGEGKLCGFACNLRGVRGFIAGIRVLSEEDVLETTLEGT